MYSEQMETLLPIGMAVLVMIWIFFLIVLGGA